MSILIKGMDKPTDCGYCPFEDFGYCNVKGERNTSEEGVDDNCPLIEVGERKTEPQYDFSAYADRLWKIAYERGKREALEQTEPQTEIPEYAEWKSAYEKISSYGEREGE